MFAVLLSSLPCTVIDGDGVTLHNVLWKAERVGEGKVNVGTVVLHVLVGSGGSVLCFFFAELCLVLSPWLSYYETNLLVTAAHVCRPRCHLSVALQRRLCLPE